MLPKTFDKNMKLTMMEAHSKNLKGIHSYLVSLICLLSQFLTKDAAGIKKTLSDEIYFDTLIRSKIVLIEAHYEDLSKISS